MDENAPVHRAHAGENYKDENGITFMNWPAQSPDLNLIENIWLYIMRQLQKSTANIATKNYLFSVRSRVCGSRSIWNTKESFTTPFLID